VAQGRPAPERIRRAATAVLVPALIAAALFLFLEGAVRLAGRIGSGAWPKTRVEAYSESVGRIGAAYRTHPFLVVAGRPNALLRVFGKEVRFNAMGERGTNLLDLPLPKPAGTFRIVCEGGSTTFDLLAADNAATWPARLGALLAPDAVDVANAGFPGWTSLESLVSLEVRDVALGPDLVVVYSGVNDLQPASHEPFHADYSVGHADILPRVTGVVPVPVRLVSRSLLLEKLLDRLRPRHPEGVEGYSPAFAWKGGARKDDIPAAAVAVYETNLRSTVGVASAHGAKTLLVAQTAVIRKGREEGDREWLKGWAPGLTPVGYLAGLSRYNAVARKLGDEGLALFVDPFAGGGFGDDDFSDPCHFSAAGSEKFARRLSGLVRVRFLPSR
jgi:lysophospholipase L1-like esterase